MIAALKNAMRLQAQRAMAQNASSAIGTVAGYDPNNYAVKVTLQPDGIVTGWMPLAAVWMGNGWGMFAPPSVGDMVNVEFINNDLEAGVAQLRYFNSEDRPLAVQSGEFWLVHVKGQSIKLTNDGALTMTDGQGATIELDGAGNIHSQANAWNHTGPVNIDGSMELTGGVSANDDVTAGSISLMNHVHPGVTPGSDNTAPPTG